MEHRFAEYLPQPRPLARACVLAVLLCAGAAAASQTHPLANGLTVTVHGPKELLARCETAAGALMLNHPGLGDLELLRDPADPRLPRAGVEVFVPLDADVVLDALAQVTAPVSDLEVEVLLLPSPPAELLGSFSVRNLIVLSPGFAAVPASTVHWVTVHELGHVLTWARFDRDPTAWDRYRELRGLDPLTNGPDAPHNAREREILAEDLRFLYGGPLATADGGIENPHLDTPDRVAGLDALLDATLSADPAAARVLTAAAWPNPCNPRTTVELRLPETAAAHDPTAASLEILDARGRRVRLIRGGSLEDGALRVAWDGTADDGRAAATGRYFYRIGWPGLEARGAVTLVR